MNPPATKKPRVGNPVTHDTTKTLQATDLDVDREFNSYKYAGKDVYFYFGNEVVKHLNSYFLQEDMTFKVSESDGLIKVRSPALEGDTTRAVDFLWRLNFEQNSWMKNCPMKCIFFIAKRCVTDTSFLDEKLLRGFGYTGAFDINHRTKLNGSQIIRLCASLDKRVRRTVKRAADLMNSKEGHANNCDTAISESAYRADIEAYNYLIENNLLCKSKSHTTQEIFLRLPEIKEADNGLRHSFRRVNLRFEENTQEETKREAPLKENLCTEQLAAVELSMNNGVSYITGSAGRGKSSAIMEIIRRSSVTIVCTPTHASRKVVQKRAEKNIMGSFCRTDVLSYIKTHASKYVRGVRESTTVISKREEALFTMNKEGHEVLENLVLEEASMIDVVAAHELIRVMLMAFPTIIRIIFVGDTKQLKSVAKGNILEDLIRSKSIPGTTLTINHRSGALSHNIDCILEGKVKGIVMEPGKFEVVYVDEVTMGIDEHGCTIHVADTVASEMSRIEDQRGYQTHSMCYMNKEIDILNKVFRKKWGLLKKFKPGLKLRIKDRSLIHGDTVYGNDLLVVLSSKLKRGIWSLRLREWSRTHDAPEGPVLKLYAPKALVSDAFAMGYSTTCHAFQGDEADAVVIHAVQNCRFFDRLALYTAVSRARELIVLVTVRGRGEWTSIVKSFNPGRFSCLSLVLVGDL